MTAKKKTRVKKRAGSKRKLGRKNVRRKKMSGTVRGPSKPTSIQTCLALVRRPDLLHELSEATDRLGFELSHVDPYDLATRLDDEFFRALESADVVVVDVADDSRDYMYGLGVRHALNERPTLLLLDERHGGSKFLDVAMSRGWTILHRGSVQDDIVEGLRQAREDLDGGVPYSPVLDFFTNTPRVFLSYTHADAESVRAIDQWLRGRGARVDLDARSFVAGRDLIGEISRCIGRAGKIVCFYSIDSRDRYYPMLERRIGEQFGIRRTTSESGDFPLIYFRLDDTPLPIDVAHRFAVNAWDMTFYQACKELWRHILELEAEPEQISLGKYRRRPPWAQPRRKS